MVRVLDVEKEEFLKILQNRKLICFGMGRYLNHFMERNPDIQIHGIIDNYAYLQNPYLDMGEKGSVPVWPAVEFEENIKGWEVVVLVTSMALEEIVEQLDKVAVLDGVPCLIEVALEGYNVAEEKKAGLRQVVSYLVQRRPEGIIADNFEENNKRKSQKKYQIWEYFRASNIGGSKARTDIKNIAGEMGYQLLKVHTSTTDGRTYDAECSDRLVRADWLWCLDIIEENSYVLMQHPAPQETRLPEDIICRIKREKKAHIICMVHEIEELRKKYDTAIRKEEFQIMKRLSDVFIVHNESMGRYYIDQGINADRVISLDIFDYLGSVENVSKTFEKSITIAANLSMEKSRYLTELGRLSPLKIHLYGPNFTSSLIEHAPNVEYHGSIAPDVLLGKLDRGFGLVWDGESLDTCAGGFGEYLLYNNPHKLSLYLASGLPVIIWRKAAEADYVVKNNVGMVVDSLYEVSSILEQCNVEMYKSMVRNAERISSRLKMGEYAKRAVKKAEKYIATSRNSG